MHVTGVLEETETVKRVEEIARYKTNYHSKKFRKKMCEITDPRLIQSY